MFFNSFVFAVFLPLTFASYWALPARFRTTLLLLASYVFYSWWDLRFLSLIFISTLTDFYVGRRLDAEEQDNVRRRWVFLSVVVNLGILGFFKYFGFFAKSASDFLLAIGAEPNVQLLRVVLPVGISFYTFQTLSYTIDVYRQKIKPEPSLVRFALFVAFFPQLVAGPIERASRLLPQLRALPERLSQVAWRPGLTLIARGLFRKVVIADGLAPIVNQVFGTPNRFGGLTIAMGVVAFSLQIYGDFAGYTDIARGTAKLFGVDLMENFRAPYASRSFSEFWRRWHISLSTWLRDYLYIPLGGSHHGTVATYRNLLVTMLLGGLWHGAGWGFVLWGGLHGLYLIGERLVRGERAQYPRLSPVFVFAVVTFTWIPFRAADFSTAIDLTIGLFRPFDGQQLSFAPIAVALLGLATIWIDRSVLNDELDPVRPLAPFVKGLAYGTAIVAAFLFASRTSVPFIYFQF